MFDVQHSSAAQWCSSDFQTFIRFPLFIFSPQPIPTLTTLTSTPTPWYSGTLLSSPSRSSLSSCSLDPHTSFLPFMLGPSNLWQWTVLAAATLTDKDSS